MLHHVMLDLETLGTNPFASIIMIGACRFDPYAPADDLVIQEQFEVAIDPTSHPGRIDPETVLWWLDPKRELARAIWLKMTKVTLPEALDGFTDWLQDQGADKSCDDVRVWGNGSDFDNALLRQAYEMMKRDVPWSFRHNRCFRTLRSLDDGQSREARHTALFDAEDQAIRAAQIVRKLGIQLT